MYSDVNVGLNATMADAQAGQHPFATPIPLQCPQQSMLLTRTAAPEVDALATKTIFTTGL